jgi:hypothetical protein
MQLIHRCIDTDCSRARRYRGGLVASKHNSVPCGGRCFILGCNCTPTVKTKKESKTHRIDRIRHFSIKIRKSVSIHSRVTIGGKQQQKITITRNSISRGRVDHCSRRNPAAVTWKCFRNLPFLAETPPSQAKQIGSTHNFFLLNTFDYYEKF